jgi:hypothetical protein
MLILHEEDDEVPCVPYKAVELSTQFDRAGVNCVLYTIPSNIERQGYSVARIRILKKPTDAVGYRNPESAAV